YRELNIGSAKPSPLERQGVEHRLFDLLSAPEVMTAGRYRDFFLQEVNSLQDNRPISVAGGTGFYFKAIEKGMFSVGATPALIKEQVLREWEKQGGKVDVFWAEICQRDPEHAKKLHRNDNYRILRAIEILRTSSDKNITQLLEEKNNQESEFDIYKIYLQTDVSLLENRIRSRTHEMIRKGIVDEVRGLLDIGLEGWAPLDSVGYCEAKACLLGELPFSQLEESILISTRQLAKKQRTWFQREKNHQVLTFDQLSEVSPLQAQLARFLEDG
ncbi:MAG: tRNA (adenosine(37)-N6)-dimethylallyltransferase MiaA, partial [Bdellovibrionales bacterium]